MSRKLLVGMIGLCCWAAAVAQAAGERVFLLRDVNVIPMDQPIVLSHRSVLVDDGKVAAVGKLDELTGPEGARVIQGRGSYLLPGLMDMHVRLGSPGLDRARTESHLRLYLGHGITTVRNMHGSPEMLALREEVRQGALPGPTIFTASPVFPADYGASSERARQGVRQFAQRRYDLIPIERLDRSSLLAVTDEARTAGIPVAGDLSGLMLPLDEILASGLSSVEPLNELVWAACRGDYDRDKIPALVEQVRSSGVSVATLISRDATAREILEQGRSFFSSDSAQRIVGYLGPEGLDEARQMLKASRDWSDEERRRHRVDEQFVVELVIAFTKARVNVVAATASGSGHTIPGSALHDELALLVEGGVDPYYAMRTAILNPALLLGTTNRAGSIGIGKDADLILVEEHPGDNIGTLREPVGLMLRGEWFDAEQLESMRRPPRVESQSAASPGG